MADVRIKTLKNGPYEVSGGVELLEADGTPKATNEDPIYLCRCGRSANKPFCDGTHRKVGFEG
jgi:3-phenylpropionate/trans-cinnamate dioxygenase ferredoxin subunit